MKNKKNWFGAGLLLVIAALTVTLVAIHARNTPSQTQTLPTAAPRPTPKVVVEEKVVEKLVENIVEVVHEASAEEINFSLNEMGQLVTAEYYFTAVASASTELAPILGIRLGFTESSFLASYDGVITAGIDFSRIQVAKDENWGFVTVTMPPAAILSVDIDPESFTLYSENKSIFTDLSAEDYNDSLIALETTEREKALARGILTKADENARKLVRSFIESLLDPAVYKIQFRTAA